MMTFQNIKIETTTRELEALRDAIKALLVEIDPRKLVLEIDRYRYVNLVELEEKLHRRLLSDYYAKSRKPKYKYMIPYQQALTVREMAVPLELSYNSWVSVIGKIDQKLSNNEMVEVEL